MTTQVSTVPLRDKHAVIGERAAKHQVGSIVTLIGIVCIGLGVYEMLRTTFHAVLLIIDIQVIGVFVQLLASRSYKDGIAAKEILAAVFWEWGLFRNKRSGKRWHQLMGSHQPAQTVNKGAERKAFWWSIVLTIVVGGGFTVLAVLQVKHTLGAVIWFCVALWGIGIAFTFWKNSMWRGGLTVPELFGAIIWPLGFIATHIKRRRLMKQLGTQPVPAAA